MIHVVKLARASLRDSESHVAGVNIVLDYPKQLSPTVDFYLARARQSTSRCFLMDKGEYFTRLVHHLLKTFEQGVDEHGQTVYGVGLAHPRATRYWVSDGDLIEFLPDDIMESVDDAFYGSDTFEESRAFSEKQMMIINWSEQVAAHLATLKDDETASNLLKLLENINAD